MSLWSVTFLSDMKVQEGSSYFWLTEQPYIYCCPTPGYGFHLTYAVVFLCSTIWNERSLFVCWYCWPSLIKLYFIMMSTILISGHIHNLLLLWNLYQIFMFRHVSQLSWNLYSASHMLLHIVWIFMFHWCFLTLSGFLCFIGV
jgi:hypothetical protein